MDEKNLVEIIQSVVREETAGMKEDIAVLQSDVAELKTDVAELKGDVSALKADVANINHVMLPKINAMYEYLIGSKEKNDRLEVVEEKVEVLDNRVFALEQDRMAE